MNTFIELSEEGVNGGDGNSIMINISHIVAIEPCVGRCKIYLDIPMCKGEYFLSITYTQLEEIKKLIKIKEITAQSTHGYMLDWDSLPRTGK